MGEAEQDGFRLIFPVMGQCQMKNALRMTAVGQEAITRIPRGRLDARSGLASLPAQNVMLNAMLLEPGAYLHRLSCGTLPQSVIDRKSDKRPSPAMDPSLQKQAKRQTVGPARDADRDSG